MQIEEVLKQLGLSEKEARVYVTLLKTGLSSASVIARQSGLPRQTTYSLLEALIEKGFIEQSDKKGIRQFHADSNQLRKLIQRRKENLEHQNTILEEELPKLLAENKQDRSFPVVQYYEGRAGLKRLFENILDQYKRGKIKSFRGYGINQFYPGLENFMKYFVKERHTHKVRTNLFIANAPDGFDINEEGTALGRTFKRLNIDEQQAAIYFVGNAIYLFSYKDNVGVMVENQAIAGYLKDVFDILWEKI